MERGEQRGRRLSQVLRERHPEVSRAYWERCFEQRRVFVDGRLARENTPVEPRARVEYPEPPRELRANEKVRGELELLHSDEDCIVFAKPGGMPSTALGVDEHSCAVNGLLVDFPEMRHVGGEPRDAGLVHRLDVGTAGLLVGARTDAAHASLRESLHASEWDKRYLAVTSAMARVPRVLEHVLTPEGARGQRMRQVRRTDGDVRSWRARSEISWRWQGRYVQVLEVRADKAVRHQVRAQLALANGPLFGDVLYDGPRLPGYAGFALVAHRLVVPHPTRDETLAFRVGLPARLRKLLEDIEDGPLPAELGTPLDD